MTVQPEPDTSPVNSRWEFTPLWGLVIVVAALLFAGLILFIGLGVAGGGNGNVDLREITANPADYMSDEVAVTAHVAQLLSPRVIGLEQDTLLVLPQNSDYEPAEGDTLTVTGVVQDYAAVEAQGLGKSTWVVTEEDKELWSGATIAIIAADVRTGPSNE